MKTKTNAAKGTKAAGKGQAAKDDRKPVGIVALIETALTKATAAKPVSKSDLLKKLTAAFPDRDPIRMNATINAQVPGRIAKERGYVVTRVEGKGYFAVPVKGKAVGRATVVKAPAAKATKPKADRKPAKSTKPAATVQATEAPAVAS